MTNWNDFEKWIINIKVLLILLSLGAIASLCSQWQNENSAVFRLSAGKEKNDETECEGPRNSPDKASRRRLHLPHRGSRTTRFHFVSPKMDFCNQCNRSRRIWFRQHLQNSRWAWFMQTKQMSVLIKEGLPQPERLQKLNQIAISQMTVLESIGENKLLKWVILRHLEYKKSPRVCGGHSNV